MQPACQESDPRPLSPAYYASIMTHACCTLALGPLKLRLQPQEFCLQESENPGIGIPVAQVETERQRSVSVHVWHIWLPLGLSLSDNRFLSVFRWIKLTRDQAQPNIAFAFRGGHMRRLWARLTLMLGNALVIWGRGMLHYCIKVC